MQTNVDSHAGATVPEPPVFATYHAAHHEAMRRRAQEAERGFVVQVEKSPYGGYYVRSWPEEVVTDPELRSVFQRGEPDYWDL